MDLRSYFSSSSTSTCGSSDAQSTAQSTEEEIQSEFGGPSAPKKVCRRYNSKWEQAFPWLEFSEDVQGIFCKVCKKWARESQQRSRGV